MEHCRGQAAMVHADHVNSWWGVELLIPLLKHTKYYYFCVKSMCRPMPTRGKLSSNRGISHLNKACGIDELSRGSDLGYEILMTLGLGPP